MLATLARKLGSRKLWAVVLGAGVAAVRPELWPVLKWLISTYVAGEGIADAAGALGKGLSTRSGRAALADQAMVAVAEKLGAAADRLGKSEPIAGGPEGRIDGGE